MIDFKPAIMLVYIVSAVLLSLYVLKVIFQTWIKFKKRLNSSEERDQTNVINDVSSPLLATILWLAVLVFVLTTGYSLTIGIASPNPTPMNQRLQESLEETQNFQPPQQQELQKRKESVIQSQYEKPHKESLSSFDEAMRKEAQKIKERNPELQGEK